jgi:hypothetical protein
VIFQRQFLTHSLTLSLLLITAIGCNRVASGDVASVTNVVASSPIEVFRSESCGCCGQWVKHMQEAGFTVSETITEDMDAVKQQHGVTEELASCHTAIAAGYVIEGHIPAEDVQRLLTEKPDVTGIAVPGMPIGSPGMEVGDEQEPYAVLSFKGETIETFAEHP